MWNGQTLKQTTKQLYIKKGTVARSVRATVPFLSSKIFISRTFLYKIFTDFSMLLFTALR